ncbi:MAG TPA: leucine--tRNA ligase [Bacteroidales bacterium]|nr:leucine--tRNA ligase [Bacteroidales bacterium]
MSEYNFCDIESRWQHQWREAGIYRTGIDSSKPKYYVLDMFPYPSGAGLHVGHPLGYIASDIFSRYKRLKGFNVLHPMGYDAYGLPAEQYAIQTGQHPEKTTNENIARYRKQMDKIGFCYDWEREVRTCDPKYYHWTQWAFIEMFNHYYDTAQQIARPITELIEHLTTQGTKGLHAAATEELTLTAQQWNAMDEALQQQTLMNYRIAYLADTKVNWCPKLGTVLANDEVSDGLSVRGGYPVEQRVMKQWNLRVSAYAQRLLDGLDTIDWSESIKDSQRNWIGRSEGAEMHFQVIEPKPLDITIFTTRADTIYGVTFMVLAPESEYVPLVTTEAQRDAVKQYLDVVKHRTELERIADRKVTGVFTGAYAMNPIAGTKIPIYISDYVLAGYGTGAIMAVPAHDSRDYAFAKHFNLPIIPLIEGADVEQQSFDAKEGIMMNSPIEIQETKNKEQNLLNLNGLTVKEAIAKTKHYITEHGIGNVKVNYRLRDAIFSRQRYWGEPFPVYYKKSKDDELYPVMLPLECLPLQLPEVDKFLPTEDGQPPLGNAKHWAWDEQQRKVVDNSLIDFNTVFPLELCTMPGFAGSSAYYLRYMDPHNDSELVSRKANEYWQQVDLYLGGREHATGHLIYSRFWNKFLYDLKLICRDEPFAKLINQGMIQGRTNFVYRIVGTKKYVSYGLKDNYDTQEIRVNVNIVHNDILDIEAFRAWMPEYQDAEFILEDGKYICGNAIEKMSKSYYNVVNPDDIVEHYGADTLRLYEMFLGPLEQSKPWDTNGIDGVHRFLKRLWTLYDDINDEQPTPQELKSLHKTIKKVSQDIETFSFNTSIPAFMICQSELTQLKCHKRAILEPLTILISPFAPHIAEELWHKIGNNTSVIDAQWPEWNEKYLVESTVKYPVSFNGKVRFTLEVPADMHKDQIEHLALTDKQAQNWLADKQVKKIIVVPGRIVNIVL